MQSFCWISIVCSLVPPAIYSALLLLRNSLLQPADYALNEDLLSRSHIVILCWIRILSGLLLGVLSNFQYSFVVLIIIHSGWLVFVTVRRPFLSRIMTIRSIVNEATILAMLVLFAIYVLVGQNDDAVAEVIVWLLLVNTMMNAGFTLYPVARCLCAGVMVKGKTE